METPKRKVLFSYSKISTFESCLLKYVYSYIDKLCSTESPLVTRKGNVLHKTFEELALVPEAELTEEKKISTLMKAAATYHLTEEDVKNCKLKEGLDKWCWFKKNYIDKAVNPQTEKKYVHSFGNIQMTCILDLVLPQEDGSIWIFDYKTPSGKDATRYTTQTNLYRYVYSKLNNIPVDKIRTFIFYPLVKETEEKSIDETTLDEAQFEVLIKKIQSTMAQMMLFNPEGKPLNDLKKESFMCSFCPYANTIPELDKNYRGCTTTFSRAPMHKFK